MLQKQSDLALQIPASQISPFYIVVREKQQPRDEVWMPDNSLVSSEHLNGGFFTCTNLPHQWEAVRSPQLVQPAVILAATLGKGTGQSLEVPVTVKCCKQDL